MITNIEKIKTLLKEKGIKPTFQRLKILEFMSNNLNNHPTVEMVYEKLHNDIPTLSLTTVYNTMNSFLEKKLVYGITITGTEIRYDFDTKYHHHFLCKKCGQIFDIEVKCTYIEREKSIVSGHRIDEIHGYFKGICKDCSKSEGKKPKGRSSP